MPPLFTLRNAALLASEAYESGTFEEGRWESYHAATDTRCVVKTIGDRVSIACRGTFSLRNWFVNFRFWPRRGCHAGIAAAADYHERGILLFLQNHPPAEIWLVGHSLGGGLVTEIAGRMVDIPANMYVVTFGAVRCHTKARAAELNDRLQVLRVLNNNDVVPRILGLLYRHIPTACIYFDRRGQLRQEMPAGQKLWDMLAGRLRNPFFDGLGDHSMRKYSRLAGAVRDPVVDLLPRRTV